jgi:hypothetical protein
MFALKALFAAGVVSAQQSEGPMTVKVIFDSLCPGSRFWFKNTLNDLLFNKEKDALHEFMKIEYVPLGFDEWAPKDFDDVNKMFCNHGPRECFGNMAVMCAANIMDDTWSKEQGPLTELGKFVQCFMSSDEAISIATDKVEDASWIRAVLNDCARQQKVRADQIIAIEKCVGMYGKTGDDVKYFQLTDMPKESLELYKKTQTRQKAIVGPLRYSKDRFEYIPYVAIDDDLPYEQFYAHTPDAALDIVCSRASDNKPKALCEKHQQPEDVDFCALHYSMEGCSFKQVASKDGPKHCVWTGDACTTDSARRNLRSNIILA